VISAPAKRLLVDVTQYVHWPATSGVQRVLQKLAANWRGRTLEASFGFIEAGSYVTGPISELASVIAAAFRLVDEGGAVSPESIRHRLSGVASRTVATNEVAQVFAAYLLPEPTLRDDHLAIAFRLGRLSKSFFLYYDALPLTHPQFFGSGCDGNLLVTRYNHVIASSDNVAFISQAARTVFEARIARRTLPNAMVARPGADGLPHVNHSTPDVPTFTMLGTIEPRKRYGAVLDAFEGFWETGRKYRLVIIGAPGAEEPRLLERLTELAATDRLDWIKHADDKVLARTLSGSSAMIFPSEGEGYGIPPLEALALGCPVVVSASLPALDGLPGQGQIRLGTISADNVAAAVQTLADPNKNAEYRKAAAELQLPTWQKFATDLEDWIVSSDAHDVDLVGSGR
jgi:glycosyltransferase involved in cell wall biosynthesis